MKPKTAYRPAFRRWQRGMSIVELMIAMTLGLLLTLAMGQLFTGNKQTYRYQDALSKMQENGRFALDFLSRDLRSAGHIGSCIGTGDQITNIMTDSYATRFLDVSSPATGVKSSTKINAIQGFTGSGSSYSPTLDSSISTAISDFRDPYNASYRQTLDQSSDVLTLRLNVGTTVPVTQGMTSSTDNFRVGGNALHTYQILSICDGGHVTLFQAGDVRKLGGAQRVSGSWNLQNAYSVGAEVTPILTRTYYVADNPSGSGKSLWMYDHGAYEPTGSSNNVQAVPPREVIDGIERMKVVYGLKNDPEDTTPSRYVDASTMGTSVSDWQKVSTVRISLVVRSEENGLAATAQSYTPFGSSSGGTAVTPSDKRMYKVFTRTITLRNRTV